MDKLKLPSLAVPTVRLPGQPSSPTKQQDYIKDGLVFYLDGINKGSNEDAWTDLVGGIVFENNGAVALKNGWRFDNIGGNLLSYLESYSIPIFPLKTHTIEVVFRNYQNESTSSLLVIFPNSNSIAAGYSIKANSLSFTLNERINFPAPYFPLYDLTYIASAYKTCVYNDEVLISSSGNDYWSLGILKSTIGGRLGTSNTCAFNGIIHSIRIYNRLLSEDEMRYNQKIDRRRFRSTELPTEQVTVANVLDRLPDVNTPRTLTLESTAYNTLSNEDIAIANSKGWNIASV